MSFTGESGQSVTARDSSVRVPHTTGTVHVTTPTTTIAPDEKNQLEKGGRLVVFLRPPFVIVISYITLNATHNLGHVGRYQLLFINIGTVAFYYVAIFWEGVTLKLRVEFVLYGCVKLITNTYASVDKRTIDVGLCFAKKVILGW